MRLFELEQPAVGDILEIELGDEIVEAVITAIEDGEIVAETDNRQGARLLAESYGRYYCSTDKKWKERKGPKQTREGVAEASRGTGNPGMPTPYDQGRDDAKKGRAYDNPYDQPGEEQEHSQYKKGYEQGKKPGVAEGSNNIEVGDKITWWYNKFHPNYEGIVRRVSGNTVDVYAPGSGSMYRLSKEDIRSHEKKGVAEGGPFSYGAKKPRQGSVADLAAKKRKEQDKNYKPTEPRDQRVGVAKVTKGVAEAHPNSKIYDKCWDGYEKVPGKKRGEAGSCVKEDEINEAEYQGREVKLGKPVRGGTKKFHVYVKDPKTGNVKKVNFGDPNMSIKKSNPKRRKSFRARHNCSNPGPRTKARYWSCRKW